MSETLREGFYVFIDQLNKFYRIKAVEPFQFETGRESTAIFSAVATNGESGYQNIDELEPDDAPRRLYQVRAGPKYNMRYYFRVPTGVSRFGLDTDQAIGYVSEDLSPYHNPTDEFEFWLVKNYYPSINAVNDTTITLTPKLQFLGFKYDIEEVTGQLSASEVDASGRIVTGRSVLEALKKGAIPFKYITVGGVAH